MNVKTCCIWKRREPEATELATRLFLASIVMNTFIPQHILKIQIARWVIVFIIGVLTALIAAGIDISIDQLSAIKFKLVKSRVFEYIIFSE
jgi:hypothetical protein